MTSCLKCLLTVDYFDCFGIGASHLALLPYRPSPLPLLLRELLLVIAVFLSRFGFDYGFHFELSLVDYDQLLCLSPGYRRYRVMPLQTSRLRSRG